MRANTGRYLILLVIAGAGLLSTGCTTGYWLDRGRDAADIFTLTAGYGAGGKARVGPIRAGLFVNSDRVGLRGGAVGMGISKGEGRFVMSSRTEEVELTYTSAESFAPGDWEVPRKRGKQFVAMGIFTISGSASKPIEKDFLSVKKTAWQQHLPYYTNLEVAAGLGVSVRAGVNPGEFLDFLLGWFGLDIFKDDIGENLPPSEPSEKPPQPPKKPAPAASK